MRKMMLVCGLVPALAIAHHGKYFLLTETWDMPHPGQIYFLADASWSRHAGVERFEASPGLLFAVGSESRAAFELHAHIDRTTGDSLNYAATGFELRFRLCDHGQWHSAIGVEHEIADDAGEGGTSVRFIAGREDERGLLVFNLIGESETTSLGDAVWSYRAAWGQGTASAGPSFAVELAGEMARDGVHELLPSASWRFGKGLLVKAGIGIGLSSEAAPITFRAGLVAPLG
jgi:hypothetical protein